MSDLTVIICSAHFLDKLLVFVLPCWVRDGYGVLVSVLKGFGVDDKT